MIVHFQMGIYFNLSDLESAKMKFKLTKWEFMFKNRVYLGGLGEIQF